MINIKAEAIRYGTSRFWSLKNSFFDFKAQITIIAFSTLVKDFFSSNEFRSLAFTYDSSVIHSFHNFTFIDVFLQDAILEELTSFLKFRRKKKRIKARTTNFKFFSSIYTPKFNFSQIRKKEKTCKFFLFPGSLGSKNMIQNFFLYKQFFYFSAEKNFSSNFFKLSFLNFKLFFDFQFLNPFSIVYPRITTRKRSKIENQNYKSHKNFYIYGANKFLQNYVSRKHFIKQPKNLQFMPRLHFYPILHYFFFSSISSPRHLLFSFISKLLNAFSASNFPISGLRIYPVFYLDTNVNAYAFYAIVRLKYKYILSHVIKPIINGIARYYKGFFILCNGRFTRAQIASTRIFKRGIVNFSRLNLPLFYQIRTIPLRYGASTIHLWLHH